MCNNNMDICGTEKLLGEVGEREEGVVVNNSSAGGASKEIHPDTDQCW